MPRCRTSAKPRAAYPADNGVACSSRHRRHSMQDKRWEYMHAADRPIEFLRVTACQDFHVAALILAGVGELHNDGELSRRSCVDERTAVRVPIKNAATGLVSGYLKGVVETGQVEAEP